MVNIKKFNDHTIDVVILEIIDSTGIRQLETGEADRLTRSIKEQLCATIVAELLKNLSIDDQKDLIEGLKNGSPEKVFDVFSRRIKDSEQIAFNTIELFKKRFLENYFSRLQSSKS